ncbi:hypothetical protein K501DRAFT_268710 [Backusella circina FSU 941]|nr:hypothetical protein K501DRAFT_268710 [Backusella circina FSU 941]
MLLSTVTLVFFTALSLLTTVYVATIYDIQDYYFLKDIFVPGIHSLDNIEPIEFDILDPFDEPFEVLEEAEFYARLALISTDWGRDFDAIFEEDSEASPYDLITGEPVAPTRRRNPWVFYGKLAAGDAIYLFVAYFFWLRRLRAPPPPPPPSPPPPLPPPLPPPPSLTVAMNYADQAYFFDID